MAIYHCSVTIIGRSSGRSSVAASAYRAGEKLTNERDGVTHDYKKKSGVVYSEVFAPDHAPEWTRDRGQLWNAVEQSEKRVNSQTAREINIALPQEFDREQQQEVLREYVRTFTDSGMVADCVIHDKNDGNPHAHIMLTTREISQQGFTEKNRDWNSKERLEQWRQDWQDIANKHLERAGIEERIDCRTLEAQGIDRQPTIHIGHEAAAMERRGIATERGNINREIEARNGELYDIRNRLAEIEVDLADGWRPVERHEPEQPPEWLREQEKAQPGPSPATGQRTDQAAPVEKTTERRERTDAEIAAERDNAIKPYLQQEQARQEEEIRKKYQPDIDKLNTDIAKHKEDGEKFDRAWFKRDSARIKLNERKKDLDNRTKQINYQRDRELAEIKTQTGAEQQFRQKDPAGYARYVENDRELAARRAERQRQELDQSKQNAVERAQKQVKREKNLTKTKERGKGLER